MTALAVIWWHAMGFTPGGWLLVLIALAGCLTGASLLRDGP